MILLRIMALSLIIMVNATICSAQAKHYLQLHMGAGVSTPMPKYRFAPMFAGLGTNFDGGFDYFFGKFGIASRVGASYHPTQKLFRQFIDDRYNASTSQVLTSKWETIYGLLGPVYKHSLGNLEIELTAKLGLSQIKVPSMVYVKPFEQQNIELFSFYGAAQNSWQPSWSAGTRLIYKFSPITGLQLNANYLGAILKSKNTYTNVFVDVQDRNKNGSLENAEYFTAPRYVNNSAVALDAVNINLGLVFQLQKSSQPKPTPMFGNISITEVVETPKKESISYAEKVDDEPKEEVKQTKDTPIVKETYSAPEVINVKSKEIPKEIVVDTKPTEDQRVDTSEITYNDEAAKFLYRAGESYFAANDFESALPLFNKLKADPAYPHANYMFAMTLSAMGNCDEAKKEYQLFIDKYKGDDLRTLKILFQSQIERCKTIKLPSQEDVIAANVANGVSYKIQFIAMKQSDATFPRLASINAVGKEFLQDRGIYRYNLEVYYDVEEATRDMERVRKMGFKDAFIAMYVDNKRVDTLHHAK